MELNDNDYEIDENLRSSHYPVNRILTNPNYLSSLFLSYLISIQQLTLDVAERGLPLCFRFQDPSVIHVPGRVHVPIKGPLI